MTHENRETTSPRETLLRARRDATSRGDLTRVALFLALVAPALAASPVFWRPLVALAGTLVFALARRRARRRVGDVYRCARRLEEKIPALEGLAVAALDLDRSEDASGSETLKRETSRRVEEVLARDFLPLPRARRDAILLGLPDDPRSLARRFLLRALAFFLCGVSTFFSFLYFFQSKGVSPANPKATAPIIAVDLTEYFAPDVVDEERETKSWESSDPETLFDALYDDVKRYSKRSREFAEDASRTQNVSEIDFSALVHSNRALVEDGANLRAREDALRRALANLLEKGAVVESSRTRWETARAALDLRAEERRVDRERETRLSESLGRAYRSKNAKARREASRDVERFATERAESVDELAIACEIFAKTREWERELAALDARADGVLNALLDALAERPGEEFHRDEIRVLTEIEALEKDRSSAIERYGELTALCARNDAARVREILENATSRVDFSAATRAVERINARATEAAAALRSGRRGLAATLWSPLTDFRVALLTRADADGPGSTSEKAATRLAFGGARANAAAWNLESAGPDVDETATTGEEFSRAAEGEARDDATNGDFAEEASRVARGEGVGADEAREVENVPQVQSERGSESGRVSDEGNAYDSQFAGGAFEREKRGAIATGRDAAFWAELPSDAREKLEESQRWNPPEEERQKTREFRRALWKATRGE